MEQQNVRISKSLQLSSKGQITIPQRVREQLGVGVHDRVEFREVNGQVVLVKSDVNKHDYNQIVDYVTLNLRSGTPVILLGASATGKSYLANAVAKNFGNVTYFTHTDYRHIDGFKDGFADALQEAISTDSLIILDEYTYLRREEFLLHHTSLEGYKGAILVALNTNPSSGFGQAPIAPTECHIELERVASDFGYCQKIFMNYARKWGGEYKTIARQQIQLLNSYSE